MNFVEWTFLQMWEYTKLTFRLIFWFVRLIAALVSRVLNMRQATPTSSQADLFGQPADKQK